MTRYGAETEYLRRHPDSPEPKGAHTNYMLNVVTSSIVLYTTCIPLIEEELKISINDDDDLPGGCRKVKGSSISFVEQAVEILNVDKEGYTHVGTPSADNISPDKILFMDSFPRSFIGKLQKNSLKEIVSKSL